MEKFTRRTELENTLVYHLRPHFLKVAIEDEYFHIVISHPRYSNLSIPERIGNVFSLIKTHNSDILSKETLIIEVFSPDEMNDLFQFWL